MKARIRIEAVVEVDRKDYKALESAGPVELVMTAEMQGAKVSVSVERTRKPEKTKAEKQAEEKPAEQPGDESTGSEGEGDS